MEAEVIKRLPLYKSTAVDDNNDHKLYWIDIILENGLYTVQSYAQLYRKSGGNVISGRIRQYSIHRGKYLGECVKYAQEKLRMKENRRGYRKVQDREEMNVTASPESILKFLMKYG